MNEDNKERIIWFLESKKLPAFIGSENFAEWLKKKYYKPGSSKEIIETKSKTPATNEIIQVVCTYLDVEQDEILISRRDIFNEPGNIAIYLVRKLRREPLV